MDKIKPELFDIPETLLWTLHNRACESLRADGVIKDFKCEEIYHGIDYNYQKSFGKPDGSHAIRSVIFDEKIRDFLASYPDGVIVNLGEGLETQRFRVQTENVLWLSVDVPDAITLRERFITPDVWHRHVALSALDTAWFAEVPSNRPVFITAQGLFMYFTEAQMQALMRAIGAHFSTSWLMFDYIPMWFSRKTCSEKGMMKTRHYRAPAMPWGIDRRQVHATFSHWLGKPLYYENVPFIFPRGWRRWMMTIMQVSWLSKYSGGIALLKSDEHD